MNNTINIAELLQTCTLFSRIGKDHLRLVAESLEVHTYERGQLIFRQGSAGDRLHILVAGQVLVYTSNELEQDYPIIIFRTGDFFGELALCDGLPRSANVRAMRPTTTLVLEREAFRRMVRASPLIAEAIIEALSMRLRRTTTYCEHLSQHSVQQRVVRLLLALTDDYGTTNSDGSIRMQLGLNQDEIASMFGTTRETINRELGKLRKQQLISLHQGEIVIPSIDPLLELLN
jgi:CRP/FNR family transcriptional regulator, cyclic AMP receptor protein